MLKVVYYYQNIFIFGNPACMLLCIINIHFVKIFPSEIIISEISRIWKTEITPSTSEVASE